MNRIFNKANGLLFVGLLGGILITGLGSGIAFAEYMSFEYDESSHAREAAHEVEEFTYEMQEGERICVPASRMHLDETLAEGIVRVEVEYDSQTMTVAHNVYSPSQNYATCIEVYSENVIDEFEVFMANKDVVLQGLKEGKLVAVGGDYYFDVSVMVNPADKDRVFVSHEEARRAYETESGSSAGRQYGRS